MLKIVTLPNPKLRERSTEIDRDFLLSPEIQTLIIEMSPKMYTSDGIGLAAPQVGYNIRLCIIGKEALKLDKKNKLPVEFDLILVNPTWQKTSRKTNIDEEGCLSVPGIIGKVKRQSDIEVEAWNEKGEKIKFAAHNYFARVIQHEVDHLDGILFIDKAKDIQEIK
ncbi:MAG: Peptide deformylase [Candidatus Magasanikbacteria bacterium GW2011_GWC2_37_14]|uniref:Peptide deformylase n=1 Tax=Candidatus Magasanikbacteria bacterium GW2011_GWC2_37_14 TaxID=1619046 RepID=A0A0G0GAK7_9BACT|nr:MAG: Peptide deformylase [Candidatus Magasanikbacteria bacterium GW2011_GWC2_37_14]